MRKLSLFAVVAAMFAACSSNDKLDNAPDGSQPVLEKGAVGFDAYSQRTTTRSGKSGIMDLAQLKTANVGFGVFGYYTDNNEYEQSRIPDFMYNQHVTWDAVNNYWAYEPVKYWPNEYGNSANSDDNDRVSFFAYAPYVEVQPTIGKVVKANSNDDQWGITALSRNSVAGDPLVKYIASFETDKRVDLLWGVCDDPQWAIVQGGTVQQINEGKRGLPWLNVERPMEAKTQQTADQRLKFTFKHALAQFSVNIDAFVDGLNANNPLADKTKIYVRQISFTGFALKGALNLNNTDPNKALWLDYNGAADIESGAAVTIFDGRKDGKEGTAGADASNEKARGLNPDIISNYNDVLGRGNTTEGVTNVTKPLFASGSPAMVIPTGEDMEVEIIYDVETEDENLSTNLSDGKTKGSSIENRIMKTVSFGSEGMQNGKHYTLNLHLGMNSVKFDAAVSPWEEATDKPEADLPLNMPSFVANTTAVENEVEITSVGQPYMFAVYGLTPGEAVTATVVGATGGVLFGKTLDVSSVGDFSTVSVGSGNANTSGIAYIRVTGGLAANNTVNNIAKSGIISVKGTNSNKEVQVSMAQFASKLDLGVATIDAGANGEIVLSSGATVTWPSDVATPDNSDNSSIIIKKNGVRLTYNGTPTAANEFGWTPGSNTITIGGATASALGDVYDITVKAGDAAAETFVASVGGISFTPASFSVIFGETGKVYPYQKTGTGTVTANNWSSATTSVATINPTTGVITTASVGTSVITANPTISDDPTNGWYYTAATKTANYTLTVNKQPATISIATPTPSTTLTTGSVQTVCTQAATLTGSITGVLAASTSCGTVTYTVDDTTNFTVDASGQLETKATTPAATYIVKVTATVADGTEYTYATKTASYTITVTVM